MLSFDFNKTYEIFSIYHRVPITDACPCCIDSETLDNLNTLELKLLDFFDILYFLQTIMTSNEMQDSLKALLPRIFELAATNEFAARMSLLEYLRDSLIKFKWSSWKSEEIQEVKKYFIAYSDFEPQNPILRSILSSLEISKIDLH